MSKKIDFGGRFDTERKKNEIMKTFTSELCDEFYFVEQIYAENLGIQDFEKGAFRNCENLQELRLAKNHLESLTDLNLFRFRESRAKCDVTMKKSKLRILDLSGNKLSFIDPAVFEPLTSLEELNLSQNELETLPEFKSMPEMKKLLIGGNQFTDLDLPKLHEKFVDLEYLEICPNTRIENSRILQLLNYLRRPLRIDTNEKECSK
ncbi:leucine-rich repeats and immunoglobulin-like domains protein 3 [Culicoides brevitarsis]|uniref:leucine-rich repeats and immunoglobulin-like domains protein 3 n=1 Tax=Culicoides brevitarsis TaxID=469753 RepID=UPI00307BA6E0